jgi:hypothetical protein
MGIGAREEQPWTLLETARSGPQRGEPEHVLTPAGRGGHPRGRGLRVVGPGRFERDYQERIGVLSGRVDTLHRALEDAALVERGTSRVADRLEAELEAARGRETEARHQLHRTLVLLGAAQREAEGLREALGAATRKALGAATRKALAPAAPPTSWFARLLGRARR